MELLLIVILALIVFGPAKLPEIMGQVGKAINDFRRATSDLSEEFNKTIQAELQEGKSVVEEARSVMSEARTAVSDVHSSVNSAVAGAPLAAPTRVAEPAPSLNGNGTAYDEPKPALADTSQWSWETAAPPAPASETAATTETADTVAASSVSADPNEIVPAIEDVPPTNTTEVSEPAPKPEKKPQKGRDELLPPY